MLSVYGLRDNRKRNNRIVAELEFLNRASESQVVKYTCMVSSTLLGGDVTLGKKSF